MTRNWYRDRLTAEYLAAHHTITLICEICCGRNTGFQLNLCSNGTIRCEPATVLALSMADHSRPLGTC